jgi:hypothetical protein
MSLPRLGAVLVLLALAACGEPRQAVRQGDDEAAERDEKRFEDAQKKDRKKDRDELKDRDDAREKNDKKDQPRNVDLGDVHAEVTALQVLHSLDLTADQLKALADLAEKTAQKAPPRKQLAATDKYRKALLDLRAALRTGDDEKIDTAMTHLDAVREKEDEPEFDEIEITDAARKHAPAVFDKLNARQVVFYLSGLGNEFPDPTEKLTAALAESRVRGGKEWRNARDDVAYQVGWLIAGLDADKEEKARAKVTALLDKAHDLTEKEFDEQKPTLEKAARDLVGKLSATDVLRHYVERVLAETLSNYRLAAAIEGRTKK